MNKFEKKNLKSRNGITLIALVVTIIVLLILAGISISMLSGNNGILKRAGDAKNLTEEAENDEQIILDQYADLVNNLTEESTNEISFYLCEYYSGHIYGPFNAVAGLTWREWINTYSPDDFWLSSAFVEYGAIGEVYPKDTVDTDTDDLRDIPIHDGATYWVVGN